MVVEVTNGFGLLGGQVLATCGMEVVIG